jgi:LysM repeat protein
LWHAATVDADETVTYCGLVDQDHVESVRALADSPDTPCILRDHPRQDGSFFVPREDGVLDMYVPVGASEFRVYEPDGEAKTASVEDLPRGASGPAYISGAVRLGGQSIGGASDSPSKPPRAVWHTTESPAGGNYLTSIGAYLIRVGAEPQVIYCPVTDRIGQFGPLTSSGRALRNDGSYRTNRTGKVCIQVEVLGYAKSPWTKGFDPSKKPNYQRLIAAMRAHGIPDVWPVGKPPATAAAATKRPRDTWENEGGHFGHSQIRGQDHWDPGAIDTSIVPGKAPIAPAPSTSGGTSSSGTYTVEKDDTLSSIAAEHKTTVAALVKLNSLKDPNKLSIGQKLKLPGKTTAPAAQPLEPFPGAGFFHGGRYSSVITAMGRRLVAEGCSAYGSGPGPNWTNADRASYRKWQVKYSKEHNKGWTGDALDGIPGKESWDALRVPRS